MQSVYGAEHAELNVTNVHLSVSFAVHMPAYIVTPPGIPCVSRRRREIRQVRQRIVGNVRVARKTYGVSMGSYPRISRKYYRRIFRNRIVDIMIMVKRPQRI